MDLSPTLSCLHGVNWQISMCALISGVQKSGDVRGSCLIVCPYQIEVLRNVRYTGI